MNKFDYFKHCMLKEAYKAKAWVISAFSVTIGPGPTKTIFLSDLEREIDSLRLRRDDFGKVYFNDINTGAAVYLDDVEANVPAFNFKDVVSLKAGDTINLDHDVTTTYGAWLFNNIVLVYPFGAKIPYSANGYTIRELERLIEKRLTDNPAPGEEITTGDPRTLPIYVYEYVKYNEAAGSLTGFTQLCVPAATPYTLSIDPAILKRRDELLAQYKDQLQDPVIQARIGNELIAMDKAWNAQDPDKGFYYRDKSFNVVRKALFLFQGSESGFDRQGAFIPTSLDEGNTLEELPDLANAQRSGSYSRGAQTALGGEATKFNLRMFQNSQVVPGDCGSKLGKPVTVTKENVNHLVGSYVLKGGESILITDESATAYLDQEIELRSPLFCLAPDANFCSICVGDRVASTPDALSTYAADIGSLFMLSSMKKMHGRALQVAKLRINHAFK